jgi:hypothetical protein
MGEVCPGGKENSKKALSGIKKMVKPEKYLTKSFKITFIMSTLFIDCSVGQ